MFQAIEKDNAAWVCVWWCYCTVHSIVEVKFVVYVLNLTHRFVMPIISYANVMYFIGI